MRAIDLEGDERRAYVESVCAEDDRLRGRVHSLMAALGDTGTFLETPALGASFPAPDAEAPLLDHAPTIPGYRIVGVIGDGGMATVYEAIQDRPSRHVALKVLKRSLARSSAAQRFEYETEILARLRHPGIAQIYEAGSFTDAHGDTIPFFALEFIENAETITKYADRHNLDTEERVKLFIEVCNAVSHGHQNGVIHRDLKPSNVLVDASGCPKVIDFGIARSTDPEQAWITQRSDLGKLIGTLNSMSPEQCSGMDTVDLRTDVYSLGTILYELLCGRVPHDLSRVPVPEALRIVQQDAPSRPASLNPRLQGDLDVILSTALEKDRARRYQTASELAGDLRRTLEHQPITARPATTMYQIRKFTRRHRVPVGAGVAIALTLIVGIAMTTRQAYVATAAKVEAVQAREAEEIERARAQEEAATAQAINAFWIDIIQQGSPNVSRRVDLTVREALDNASPRIDTAFENPVIRSQLHLSFAAAYRALTLSEPELHHARSAWEIESEAAQPHIGRSLRGRLALAHALIEHEKVEEAESLLTEGLAQARRELGETSPLTLQCLTELALLHSRRGNYEEAAALQQAALDGNRITLGDDHPTVLRTRSMLLETNWQLGRYIETESLLTENLELQLQTLGLDHPDTMGALNFRARVRRTLGRLEDAEEDLRLLAEIVTDVLGEEHGNTLTLQNNLAGLLREMGRLEEAEEIHRNTLRIRDRLLGPDHRDTLMSMSNLAMVLVDKERLGEAEAMMREVLERRSRLLGESHPDTLMVMRNLAEVLTNTGRLEESERLYLDLLEGLRAVLPSGRLLYISTLRGYGVVLMRLDRPDEAVAPLLESHDSLLEATGGAHPQMEHAAEILRQVYEQLGDDAAAARWEERRDAYRAASPG